MAFFSSPTSKKDRCGAKVAIVGAGFVGSTTAYTLMLNGAASHIALVDINKDKAEGEALELQHCMQFAHSIEVTAGDSMSLVEGASIVVLCAGLAQKPGQSRFDLLDANVQVFKDLVPQIVKHNKDCILLVVTNPLDVLTYVTLKLSGFPPCRVFGTGTVLDSARLRYQLGMHFRVSPKDVVAHILGEHGESEFVCWSGASIAGVPLTTFADYDLVAFDQMYKKTKSAAGDIIARKGATYYAIALVATKIIRAILLNQARVFSVSTLVDGQYGLSDVCLSVPTVIREGGVCEHLTLALNAEEQKLLARSAGKIHEGIARAMALIKG
jgi:L-lactate dehydrogenase